MNRTKNIINLNNYHRLVISESLWKTFKCDKYNRYFYRSTLQNKITINTGFLKKPIFQKQKIKKNEKYMI
jgi:hypothetical protein